MRTILAARGSRRRVITRAKRCSGWICLTFCRMPTLSPSTEISWGQSSKGGARELPGPVLAQLKNDSEFYKEIRTRELYRKLTLIGKSTIGDSEVYVIETTPLS